MRSQGLDVLLHRRLRLDENPVNIPHVARFALEARFGVDKNDLARLAPDREVHAAVGSVIEVSGAELSYDAFALVQARQVSPVLGGEYVVEYAEVLRRLVCKQFVRGGREYQLAARCLLGMEVAEKLLIIG